MHGKHREVTTRVEVMSLKQLGIVLADFFNVPCILSNSHSMVWFCFCMVLYDLGLLFMIHLIKTLYVKLHENKFISNCDLRKVNDQLTISIVLLFNWLSLKTNKLMLIIIHRQH